MEAFLRGRDFSAWSPASARQGEAEARQDIEDGTGDLRRLLVAGAIAVIRRALRRGTDDPWLAVATKKKSCGAPVSA